MKKIILSLMLITQGLMAEHIYDAAERGDYDGVQRLLDRGADVNATESVFRETPLHGAASEGHRNIVEMLIRRGANVNIVNSDGDTPLYWAASEGHENIVRILLENPWCDHTIADLSGKTPEDIARSNGHTKIAEMLHNAFSINKKIFDSGRGLQLFASRVVNRNGITKDQLESLPYSAKSLITNRIEDGEPGPSGY